MPVNLFPPEPESLLPVAGVELGVAMAGVRKRDRKDLLVMRLADGAAADDAAGQAAAPPASQPTVRAAQKVGRNEPCPCGSGRKYKHCHGKLT